MTKLYLTTFHQFTDQKYQVSMKWIAKEVRLYFLRNIRTHKLPAKFIEGNFFLRKHALLK